MKRWICFFLSLLLILAALPGAEAMSGADRRGSWEAIEDVEARAASRNAATNEAALRNAYAACADEMIRAVLAAEDYVPGSLDRHGDFFFWQTSDGRANGYSPSLRARLRAGKEEGRVGSDGLSLPGPVRDAENIPENRDVGVFIPYSDSYYFHPEKGIADGRKLADSTGGQLFVWTAGDADVDALAAAVESCGVLLLNSHGQTDYELGDDHVSKANSSYICLPTDAGITAADQQPVAGPYGTYRHAFYAGNNEGEEYYCVDGVCIRNHMERNAPHSMIFLGCCLSMATEGLFEPLREAGVEALIGFSERVVSDTDHNYRAALCEALCRGAALGEAVETMKETVGCPDPVQQSHAPAWPIAVSSEDPYPGRANLDRGQHVCSTWELYPAYPIDIAVEPAGSAQATVTRTWVTVTPASGFLFSDWELTAGEATAERNGNELHFQLGGPIAVTLHMQARAPAVLRFSAGPGQSCGEIRGYENDEILLPAPAGELEADAWLYHFIGWSADELTEDSPERPELFSAGTKLKLSAGETELHAVYGYFAAEDPGEAGQFREVTEAPADWTGDYVISYQAVKALRASTQITGLAISGPSAVGTEASAGYFVDGAWLNEVPDDLIWSVIPSANGAWRIKMKTGDNYLAVPASNVLLSTLEDPDAAGAQWKLQWEQGTVKITNRRFPARILQYSFGSAGFCALTGMNAPLTLYRSVPGRHLYTTRPLAAQNEPDPEPPFRFEDVSDPNEYYYEPVYWAVEHQPPITLGTSSTCFSPRASCTRAQAITFLWREKGCPGHTAENPFDDLEAGAWYCDAVLWAVENGITNGTSERTFSPNETCTRSQIVTFLWAAAGKPEPAMAHNPFVDVKESDWFYRAVLWAVEEGITTGMGIGIFAPREACTRAQTMTFLYRTAHNAGDESD